MPRANSVPEVANDPWPLLRDEAVMPTVGGPVLYAWLDFLQKRDNDPARGEVETLLSLPSPSPIQSVRVYAGNSIFAIRAWRRDGRYLTVYDASEPDVRMLGECELQRSQIGPGSMSVVVQQPGRLVLLGMHRSWAISYPDVRVSALTAAEARELGNERLLLSAPDTERELLVIEGSDGKEWGTIPLLELPGGNVEWNGPTQ